MVFSDGTLNTLDGIYATGGPFKQESLFPKGANNDADLVYVDGVYNTDRFRLKALYGMGRNKELHADFMEFDLYAFYQLTERLELGVYGLYTRSGAGVDDDHRIGSSLVYSF
jgi:hypothetical protein